MKPGTKIEVETTARGYEVLTFSNYGKKRDLAQASSFTHDVTEWPRGTSYLWVGEGDNRPHLDREAVREFHRRLGIWLETGSFRDEETARVSPESNASTSSSCERS